MTGGGTWKTFTPAGAPTGSGTYVAQRLVIWQPAPGKLPPDWNDTIGKRVDQSAGLAVLKIRYSDGSKGVLTVSCNLDDPSTVAVFEGITATKGFVDYWMPEMNTNRATEFHFIHRHE